MKKHRPSRFDELATVLTILFVSTVSSHALDLDGDGMSDVWQRIHNIATGDTASDIDGDGQSNGKEAEAGTDSRDSNDYFRTFDFSVSPAFDSVTLSWRSVEQRFYEIEESTDLITWEVAGDITGGSGLSTTATLSVGNPINDLFANRWPASTSSTETTGFNVGASYEAGEPINPSVDGGKTVWWSWSSSTSGSVTITTVGSDFDTTLAIYSGSDFSNLVLLGANYDTGGLQSSVSFTAQAGVPYSIQVDGYSGSTGSIVLNHPISSGVLPPPNISSGAPPKMFFRVRGYPENDTDADGDSLLTWEERLLGTNPYDYDRDSDNDGMEDGFEFVHQLDPLNPIDAQTDVDGDLLTNLQEAELGLSPRTTDTDGNGISDANEDRDFDGLGNLAELQTYFTNPKQPDTDLDGLFDGWEVANGYSPTVHNGTDAHPNNDASADPDGDGLTNLQEADHGTSASNSDTDGDGVSDSAEVGQGSNPADPNDSQPPPAGTVAVNITFGDDSGSHSEKYRLRLVPLEGDTSGNSQRFRTNREYGVPQTDTFRLPKGSKYRVELQHVATNIEEGGPDYDYVLEVDTSQNCLMLDDPDGIGGYHYESDPFFAEGKNATLYVPLFKPKEVSFSASTVGDLQSDNTSTTYDAPHWQDGNDDGDADDSGERKYPIAYVRNTAPTIEGKIAVKPTGLTSVSGFTVKIKVTGPGAIKIDETAATVGTDELTLPATASTGNFVKEIDYLNPMTLSWEVAVNDEGHWCEAGETKNRTYVTLGAPATTMRQETLFDIGCRNANGETVAVDATAKIWSEFTDRVVRKVDPTTGQPTGTQMTYYADYNPLDSNGVAVCTAPQLLEANDGQCGSWADLLIRIRQVQSIDDPDEYVVFGSPNTSVGFAVKNWTFAQNGTSGNAAYPYLNICPLGNGSINANFEAVQGTNSYNWAYAEVSDASGIEGQGTTNPASLFGNHQVMISGQLYDPSYGVIHATLADIDAAAVDAYFILSVENLDEANYGLDLNSDGDQTDLAVPTACYLFRKNPAGNDLIIRTQTNR